MRIECAFNAHWEISHPMRIAHTEPHPIAIHATRRAFIDLSFRVYMNLDVFGSMMAAGWSNKATKILLTV